MLIRATALLLILAWSSLPIAHAADGAPSKRALIAAGEILAPTHLKAPAIVEARIASGSCPPLLLDALGVDADESLRRRIRALIPQRLRPLFAHSAPRRPHANSAEGYRSAAAAPLLLGGSYLCVGKHCLSVEREPLPVQLQNLIEAVEQGVQRGIESTRLERLIRPHEEVRGVLLTLSPSYGKEGPGGTLILHW